MASFVTSDWANSHREPDCTAVTSDRKYYSLGNVFIKRSLRPREWHLTVRGTIHRPRQNTVRLLNEAACLRFIAQETDIPVPKVLCVFEDDGAVYLITEFVDGVDMLDLNQEQKAVVQEQLAKHVRTMQSLKSRHVGGPTGLVVPPWRVTAACYIDSWDILKSESEEYVFCHNDLGQQNVIVDPSSLKINAIIDWEYAGFYPAKFEKPYYERVGPSGPIGDEKDDAKELVRWLNSRSAPWKHVKTTEGTMTAKFVPFVREPMTLSATIVKNEIKRGEKKTAAAGDSERQDNLPEDCTSEFQTRDMLHSNSAADSAIVVTTDADGSNAQSSSMRLPQHQDSHVEASDAPATNDHISNSHSSIVPGLHARPHGAQVLDDAEAFKAQPGQVSIDQFASRQSPDCCFRGARFPAGSKSHV
ncbi:hypothetical protein MRB53_040106 [Persea americana]|nr:hypothetical protein MRB53_040106 [Persea americana]